MAHIIGGWDRDLRLLIDCLIDGLLMDYGFIDICLCNFCGKTGMKTYCRPSE